MLQALRLATLYNAMHRQSAQRRTEQSRGKISQRSRSGPGEAEDAPNAVEGHLHSASTVQLSVLPRPPNIVSFASPESIGKPWSNPKACCAVVRTTALKVWWLQSPCFCHIPLLQVGNQTLRQQTSYKKLQAWSPVKLGVQLGEGKETNVQS